MDYVLFKLAVIDLRVSITGGYTWELLTHHILIKTQVSLSGSLQNVILDLNKTKKILSQNILSINVQDTVLLSEKISFGITFQKCLSICTLLSIIRGYSFLGHFMKCISVNLLFQEFSISFAILNFKFFFQHVELFWWSSSELDEGFFLWLWRWQRWWWWRWR